MCKTLTNSKRLKQFIYNLRVKWFHNNLKCMYYTLFFFFYFPLKCFNLETSEILMTALKNSSIGDLHYLY